jgi:hypothetical protein
MKNYWDTDALLDAILEIGNARDLFDTTDGKTTRCHTFAEAFSQLTGGRLAVRMLPGDAAKKLSSIAKNMTVVSLSEKETLDALMETNSRGVRGGAVHDFLHVYAAELHGCKKIFTGNVGDFSPLTDLEIEAP